jgi:hypothetical protein
MESTHKKPKLNQDEIPRITYKWFFFAGTLLKSARLCLHKLLMIEIKRKKESNVFVIFYVKSGSLITPSCEDYKV